MTLTGTGNKCPVCGKEFQPTPPLEPNVENMEFYGGRVKFFKTVICDCTARYKLCIERRFDTSLERDVFNILDMIVEENGIPLDELALEYTVKNELQNPEEVEKKEKISTITERIATKDAIKKQTVLATIVDLDTKIETLCYHTVDELKTMCKRRKLKYGSRETKAELARTLLAYDPSLVSPNPQD